MPGDLQLLASRMVEPHALADPARGDRGRALRAPRRARPAGARPTPRGVHDPRPAIRLGARHGADARREPAPDRLRRRRPARAGRLDGGAAADRDYQPLLSVHGHIHESGGERRIGDTLCINPGSEANHGVLRGYLIDIGARASSCRSASRGRPAGARMRRTRRAETHRGDRERLRAADESVDRHVLVDHVRDADARRRSKPGGP